MLHQNFSAILLFSFTALSIICLDFIQAAITSTSIKSSSSPSSQSLYTIEFQILKYENSAGRLLSGECCGGYKLGSDDGACPKVNRTSCNPYWKICLTHQQQEKDNFVMPTQRRTDRSSKKKKGGRPSSFSSPSSSVIAASVKSSANSILSVKAKNDLGSVSGVMTSTSTSSPVIMPVAVTPTPKPGYLRAFINRILGSIKAVQSLTDYINPGDNKLQNPNVSSSSASAACSLAYFTTNISDTDFNENQPLTLRANIPASVFSRIRNSGLTQDSDPAALRFSSSSWFRDEPLLQPASTNKTKLGLQKVLVFVEIWHRQIPSSDNDDADKLIARHVEQRNTSIQIKSDQTSSSEGAQYFWEEGGVGSDPNITTSPLGSNGSTVNRGIEFKYRWRIISEDIPEELPETTTQVICPQGYKGLECKDPVCGTGCDANHGYCEKPGECKCRFGWTGEFCNLCVPMPGCVHGGCVKPFECRCEDGWSGMFCDKPSCKLGCHPQNGYCEHPGECRCRFGFKGENCSDCATMPGCQKGSCEQPLDCICQTGWKGLFCSIPLCSEGCDLDHGWCRRPDECRCRVGWTGKNCMECVPYPGCQHGTCSEPWTCECESGYGGTTCSEKLDTCETSGSNPCQNGGTCISVEKADGGHICQCPLGYEGQNCEKLKN